MTDEMSQQLQILTIDASAKDALLFERALRKEWPGLYLERVETATALRDVLARQTWDCILCDMIIPGFGASAVLELIASTALHLPVLIVSAVVEIDDAINMLKVGAYDLISKDDLSLLAPAIRRAIEFGENLRRKHKLDSKLKESEEQYRKLIQQSPISIQVHRSDGRLLHANPAFRQLWDIDDNQWDTVYRNYNILEDTEIVKAGMMPLIERVFGGENVALPAFEYDTSVVAGKLFDAPRPQTRKCWFSCRGYPLTASDGRILTVTFVIEDITERRQAEEVLKSNELEQSLILNSILDGVITIDESRTIISYNKAAEELFGYRFDEVKGQNVSLLLAEPNASNHDCYLNHHLQTGSTLVVGVACEVEGKRKNDQVFPMSLSVAEFPADSAGKRRFIGTCHDLTETKQQEEQLRRGQKMDALGKLTGGIAHDFNNSLGIITGYAQMLREMLPEKSELANYADEIFHAGERSATLTKKLLSFSRQDTPHASKVDVNEILLSQQGMLQNILTVRIKLIMDLCETAWPIWLDKNDMEDAIVNMSLNALHAMKERESDAQLVIRCRNQSLSTAGAQMLGLEAGDYVQINLIDNGSGMDETVKEKLFEPFFSTKGKEGTGLGLSQVFGFVKRAGGIIKVYSELGHGSNFVLYFPRHIGDDIDTAANTGVHHVDFRGNAVVLVVDDEPGLRRLACELLGREGYQVSCAENAKHALEILEHKHIDLILADIVMPDMDGYQLASLVKDKYPTVKIQLTSGYSDTLRLDPDAEILHRDILYKPYHARDLLKKVDELLESCEIIISEHQLGLFE